jgi:hypothetical protein
VISIELDSFAYADAHEDGRFVGLTMTKPSAVRQGGLLVDPKVALEQIEADNKGKGDGESGGGSGTDGDEKPSDGSDSDGSDRSKSSGAKAVPTRFHATRELTTNRVVRDAGQIYEEIVSHFVTSGVPVRVTLDIESEQLDRLTEDQRTAIRENLKTLRFADRDWSMD